jgi:hypothetical protein
VVHTYNPNYSGGGSRKITSSRPALAKNHSKTLFQKQNKNKRAGVITQIVECLPSMRRTLGSNSNTRRINKKKKKQQTASVDFLACLADNLVVWKVEEILKVFIVNSRQQRGLEMHIRVLGRK